MPSRLSILVVGAHPDDAEIQAGGIALLYAGAGHRVTFLSLTNGDAGHHEQRGAVLAARRAREAELAAESGGIESIVLDIHDGELEPDLENRRGLIALIRTIRPDLLITHRPYDYHPDHRYTGVLVQDASFLATVQNICPEAPAVDVAPVVMYMSDHFTKPLPFQPSIAVGIDSVISRKMDMLHCHESQMYEFLPFNRGYMHEVPEKIENRRNWLENRWAPESSAEPWRDLLVRHYGPDRGREIRHAEAFEFSEYGRHPDGEAMEKLFSFFFK
jgi:LmbE family N-acetylglucosaminyl deacetylase